MFLLSVLPPDVKATTLRLYKVYGSRPVMLYVRKEILATSLTTRTDMFLVSRALSWYFVNKPPLIAGEFHLKLTERASKFITDGDASLEGAKKE